MALHYTGNDYMSSFFRKGEKKMFWGIREETKIPRSLNLTGSTWEVTPEMFTAIQQFICAIYGSTKKNINEVGFDFFYQKYQNQNKILVMSTLPLCEGVSFLHVERANYIASIWKKANVAKPALPPFTDNGWNKDGCLTWISDIFSQEVEKILFDDEFDNNDYIDDSGESDDEEDI